MKQKNTNLNEAKDWKEILKEAENKLKIESKLEYRICLSKKYQKTLLPNT
jgi:hypothetical protein